MNWRDVAETEELSEPEKKATHIYELNSSPDPNRDCVNVLPSYHNPAQEPSSKSSLKIDVLNILLLRHFLRDLMLLWQSSLAAK